MPDERAKAVCRYFDQVAADRQHFESSWQEIADHMLGRRDFQTQRTPGQNRNPAIYDNTAQVSADLLSAGLHTLLTNTATRWFRLTTQNPRLMLDRDVAEWVEDAEDQLLARFQSPEAGFMVQMHELYIDLPSFGTAGMFMREVPGGFRFMAVPLNEIHLVENPEGRVDTVFRDYSLSARQVKQDFGERSPTANKRAEQGATEDSIDILLMVHPREDPALMALDATRLPWESLVIDKSAGVVISEGGFRQMPFLTPRWEKESSEVYGRGPGWNALPAAKSLNLIKKTYLQAGQLAIAPPLAVPDDGVVFPLRTAPWSVNTYRSDLALGGDTPIRPLFPQPPRFDISVELLERERVAVRSAYHFELLQLLQDPRMTATQVLEIAQRTQAILSPILGRQQTELLDPMIERGYGMLVRQGALLPPPPQLEGQTLSIEYISPVSRAQRTGDVQAIVQTLAFAQQLAQTQPDVMDVVDLDAGLREIARRLDTPARILRSPRDVAARRQAEAQLAEEQAGLDQASQVAQIAATAAKAERAA